LSDLTRDIGERVEAAAAAGTALCIRGGGSKDFYGREPAGEPLEMAGHAGIVSYEPTELVLTARAGTPLAEIEAALAAEGQMLPFEPPHYGPGATLGGTVACNLSGPRRAAAGAARDFVLGTRVVNGRGEALRFGGEVMKNVAGYDLSRLMAGALGTLGVVLEVSLKVLPRAETELTLVRPTGPKEALTNLHGWGRRPYPVSATCYDGESLYVRLSGAPGAVAAARAAIGGDPLPEAEGFWERVREHRHGFFQSRGTLWRLSLASDADPPGPPGKQLWEWGGALRWLASDAPGDEVRAYAEAHGGHAMAFRGGDRDAFFHPPAPGVMALHRRLKAAFDPAGVLNPGRMFPGL
jgi:glycolate oxidase FAD binding subunit